MVFEQSTLLSAVLDNPAARDVVQRYLPGVINSPLGFQLKALPLSRIVERESVAVSAWDKAPLADETVRNNFWREVSSAFDGWQPAPPLPEVVQTPSWDYEKSSVVAASATLQAPVSAARWGIYEIRIDGPSHGNPFLEVDLWADFSHDEETIRMGGFYDGAGVYLIRFMPEHEGQWSFVVGSSARSLNGLGGSFDCLPPASGVHGPVRVKDGFHFAHADGTPYLPIGTTAYAWTHQDYAVQDRTLETLEGSGFTKMRMAVFPKAYMFNTNEPVLYPFSRKADMDDQDLTGWDYKQPNPDFFHHLERQILRLGQLGIEADLILFHAYDRWGFSTMTPASDDMFVRYVVRRLAAFRNVWWSMANEYDLLYSKSEDDWERLAKVVSDNDPFSHLNSIHNCLTFYDYHRPWVTHCSIQRIDVYRTSENTDDWRKQWGKPVVIDECAYEGNIDQGWGNISGQEMTRRFWEGAVRGGYVGHGETYTNNRDELWWSKGGNLVGSSPARIAFLAELIRQSPTGQIDPQESDWDVPYGGVKDQYYLVYFGLSQPSYRKFSIDPAIAYDVDIVDTWAMTIDTQPEPVRGSFRLELPGKPYIAVRLRARSE